MPIRAAVDANVLITGVVWPRWQHAILMHALAGDFILVLPAVILAEARRRIQLTFPLFQSQFEELLEAMPYESVPVPTVEDLEAVPNLVRQQKDVPIAVSVIRAHVDYFVTYDRDFTDAGSTTAAVRAAIPGIMLPPVFLRDVMGWSSERLEQVRKRNWSDVEEVD